MEKYPLIALLILVTTFISCAPKPAPALTPTSAPLTALPTSATLGEFNITAQEAILIKALNSYNSSYENGSFLLVSLSIENIGKSQQLFGVAGEYFGAIGTAEIAVIDSKGYEYPPFSKVPLQTSTITWTVLPQMVGPKITKECAIAFDIPPDALDLRLGLRASKTDRWTTLKLPMK